jgi:hypothetical protein
MTIIEELEVLGQSSHNLLPLLCVLFLKCSTEAFRNFVSPFLFAKQAASPSRFYRKQGRKEIYDALFQQGADTVRTKALGHSYVEFAHRLAAQSERWALFDNDEILSIVILIQQSLTGTISWTDVDAFGVVLDDGLRTHAARPTLALRNLFAQLIATLYDKVRLAEINTDLKNKIKILLNDVRSQTRIQPLTFLLKIVYQHTSSHKTGLSTFEALDEITSNRLCLEVMQKLLELTQRRVSKMETSPQTTSPKRLTPSNLFPQRYAVGRRLSEIVCVVVYDANSLSLYRFI